MGVVMIHYLSAIPWFVCCNDWGDDTLCQQSPSLCVVMGGVMIHYLSAIPWFVCCNGWGDTLQNADINIEGAVRQGDPQVKRSYARVIVASMKSKE